MESKIIGNYSDEVILQLNNPDIVDVSTDDYEAVKMNINTADEDDSGVVKPFIICANEDVTLKVEAWNGNILTWTFSAGPYPMPLRRIFNDAGNSATTIQISY